MNKQTRSPWAWIPSLYFAEGLPYVVVMTVAVIMYKRLDISNTDIALYTSWLYLPWVIKPLWSPFIDIIKSKRWWIVMMQLLIGAALAGVAFTIPSSNFFRITLAFFWLLAFSSATHDIAADGFYMYGLNKHKQAYFIGIRSTFYRIAMITGQGLLIILAGYFEEIKLLGQNVKSIPLAWSLTFSIIAISFLIIALYHKFALPKPQDDQDRDIIRFSDVFKDFGETFISFFGKQNIGTIIGMLLFYRLGESQLVKMASPFLLDSKEVGGLALSTSEVGIIYGTIGVLALTIGGILGGYLASRNGLKYWIWWMVIAINLPNLVYVYLSQVLPDSFWLISASVAVEQFGYGFGFTAFMLYQIYVSDGKHKTAHFAFCTGFMALGMMLPGMISGWIQELIGYQHFFIWVILCTIPSFIMVKQIDIDPKFGIKQKKSDQ
ncbi:PAT family beta-lactamase induction signal transducer AmpG [Ancylomarina subtilis]|uniref:PAT family beta-lactamase induction signal transducer AmpG n=1 Tax=Ancylomarina subtilis TaxID=1639035 RepID=A0A4Q7VDL8_9BACT|nr:AmpG family muropeptide MFS transporter [Ancylomarina subtilis]RZT93523.1 PAT family beta-lactamase induction signal transducer AmpG [Ancylomarina subtilis]